MLIAHSSSSCDVCLEPFRASVEGSADARLPCAIQCGHVFCKQCINSFTRLICPLCRSSFDPRSIRRLHLDLSNAPLPSPVPPPSSVLFEGSDGTTTRVKEEYKARLIELIREGANASRYHALLGEVTSWLRTQAKDDHWDLRALYMLIIRYREMHAQSQAASADLKSVQEEIARLRAHENNIERRNFELSEALELLEREKAELEEELRECDVNWNEKYDVAMGEIASLREEILFFSAQRSRSHVSPVPSPTARPSGLSISRPPIEDSEDDELPPPPPPPPPPTQPKLDDSELEGIDAARFSPLGADSYPSSLPSQGFSPLQEETVLPAEDDVPSKPARRPSDAHSKPPPSKSLAITDVAARFYETIGTAPGASSSLPHPAPASYIAWRADHPAPRNRANSANKIQRVSRLQLARVADSSDEGEVERRAQRQTVLKDLLADPGRPSPLVPSAAMPSSSPPARGVSHASTAAQLPHRRTQSAEQQQTPPQVPVRQAGGFPSTPPTVEAKRPRYFERRDSSASARAEAERTRVWLPSAAGMESETS